MKEHKKIRQIRPKLVGIKKRWLVNIVPMVLSIVGIGVIAFSVSIANYYYSSAKSGLETKANAASNFFSTYITKTYAEYYDSAYKFVENFDEASTIEFQFINTSGRVVISSYGLTAGSNPGTQDITEAIETERISSWVGKNPSTGELIIAVSAPITYQDGRIIGVMRYVTGLELINQRILLAVLAACGVAVIILLITVMLSFIFIKSVVEPVREITMTSRQIADGSYGIQITKKYKYKDEISEMVDSINEMSIKISRSEKMETEFISSVSHELRTPLTAITGWGETLMYDETMGEESKRGVAIILKEAKRLTQMVEDLLDITRIQDGRFTLNVEQIDPVAELEDAIFAYRELLRQNEIDLEYTPYEGDLPLLHADPARLKQVFLNILDNAVKYGRSGKRIDVSAGTDGQYFSVSFRDYGPGIPEDELENVKMKFYKGKSKERGSGIGLAVCDEIMKYHGGKLELKNADGGGLIVTIRLPFDEKK